MLKIISNQNTGEFMDKPFDYQRALLDPTLFFSQPGDVLEQNDLSQDEKLSLLKRWEQDAREIEVAEEEGMVGTRPSQLSAIIQAIDQLDPEYHLNAHAPDKQGNIPY